jgi:hypothetical protein
MRTHGPTFTVESQFQVFRREQINFMRAVNHAFPELLEGAPPLDAIVNTSYRSFHHKMFSYLCVVMKHLIAAMALSHFQRDPSFSTRVSLGSHAWRALIDLLDQRGIGRTLSLLTKLMEPQGNKDNIGAYLQRLLHCNQDINMKTNKWLMKSSWLLPLFITLTTSCLAHVQALLLP